MQTLTPSVVRYVSLRELLVPLLGGQLNTEQPIQNTILPLLSCGLRTPPPCLRARLRGRGQLKYTTTLSIIFVHTNVKDEEFLPGYSCAALSFFKSTTQSFF